MVSPNSTFTDIVTLSLRDHPSVIADNATAHNGFLKYLKMHDGFEMVDGGYEIARPVEFDTLNYQRYSGADVLSVSGKDLFTAVKVSWCQAAVMVTSTGLETRIQNAGSNQIASLIKARMANAKKSAANNQSIDVYSNGSLSNQIGGLALILQTTGGGSYGGIDGDTYTFWNNKVRECATAPASAITFVADMNALWLDVKRGTDQPHVIIMSHDFFAFYEGYQQTLQRYTRADKGGSGFDTLVYKGVDVIHDSNSNFSTTAERGYFLNLDYFKFVVHSGTNWTTMPGRTSINQDAEVVPLFWAGNIVCTNRALQGLLKDTE